MGVCDVVASNLTLIYVAVLACVKAYSIVNGRSYGGGFVVTVSTTLVALILVTTLMWDLSRKVKYCVCATCDDRIQKHPRTCKGGICWHGVAERSPASQVCFKLPHHPNSHVTF